MKNDISSNFFIKDLFTNASTSKISVFNVIELPDNVQTQYDNTKAKIEELEVILDNKSQELMALQSMIGTHEIIET